MSTTVRRLATRGLVRLYPPAWRSRYGPELEGLIEDLGLRPTAISDLVRGAVAARFTALGPDSPLPAGGAPMPSSPGTRRLSAAATLLSLALVLPALVLLGSAAIRSLQPIAREPARTANAIVEGFAAAFPPAVFWAVIALAPLLALVLAIAVAWRRLADDSRARDDVATLGAALRGITRQPVLIACALAILASAGVLAFAVGHAIAG